MLKGAIRDQAVTLCSATLRVLAFFSCSCLMVTQWLLQEDMLALGAELTSRQEEMEIGKGLFPYLLCLLIHQGKPLVMLQNE